MAIPSKYDGYRGVETELGRATLMPCIGRHHGKAALQSRLRERSCVAADRRRHDAVVAAAALIEEAAAPGCRQAKLEARLVGLAVTTGMR
jgi:hypothetical protein